MSPKVAVFVDGDNLSSNHSDAILKIARGQGQSVVTRVYGNDKTLTNWKTTREFEFVHSGEGKNGADLHLAIDLTELTLVQRIDVVVLVTSDRDFVHLARRLTARGVIVIGCGEAKTNAIHRGACSEFRELRMSKKQVETTNLPTGTKVKRKGVSELDWRIWDVISDHNKLTEKMALKVLGSVMSQKHNIKTSDISSKNWSKYFGNLDKLYELLTEKGETIVRLKQDGFFITETARN
jgi:uncharacterized LabA/DUF88 family protein